MRVAVVGATGAVGRTILKLLEERSFPLDDLVLFASPRSDGKRLSFRGRDVIVRGLHDRDAFVERIQRRLLHLGQKIQRRFQVQALGDVLEQREGSSL